MGIVKIKIPATLSLFESTKNGCPHEIRQMKQTKTEHVEKEE